MHEKSVDSYSEQSYRPSWLLWIEKMDIDWITELAVVRIEKVDIELLKVPASYTFLYVSFLVQKFAFFELVTIVC